MIARIAAAADSNPAGSSAFVAFDVPVGVRNGDLVVVAIALPAGITVSPPDDVWTEIRQRTDPGQPVGIVAYWVTNLNAPTQWVFSLSAEVEAAGVCAVFRNADAFQPVEASAVQLTASSATHGIPGISPSLPDEELVVFLAAGDAGTYTPASGWLELARKQQSATTIEVQARHAVTAGPTGGFTEAFSTSADGAALIIALAPTYGLTSFEDARQRLVAAMPPGVDNYLDINIPGGDFYNFFSAISGALKVFIHDLVDLARQELIPQFSRYVLGAWERRLGLLATRAAQFGTIPERQAQVLAALRAAAGQGSSIPAVKGVLAPLLGYSPGTEVEVIEADWRALQTVGSSWGYGVDIPIGAAGTTRLPVLRVPVGGKVSKAGATLTLNFDTSPNGYTVKLTAPNGQSKTWGPGAWTRWPIRLYAPELADAPCYGNWKIEITNPGGANTLFAAPWLRVDGIGTNLDTGGSVYHWGVYAAPDHLGENGVGADLKRANDVIRRMAFTHTVGGLLLSKDAYPDTDSGEHAAIPDMFIPS